MRKFMLIILAASLTSLPGPAQEAGQLPKMALSEKKDPLGDPLPVGAAARIGTTRYRLPQSREPLPRQVSPDGKLLVAQTSDGFLIGMWDLPAWTPHRFKNGKRIDQLDHLGGDRDKAIRFTSASDMGIGLVFTPDSKHLLGFDPEKKQVVFLDLATGDVTRRLTLADQPSVMALSPDQQTLVTTDLQTSVQVWDLAQNKLRNSFKATHGNTHSILVASADGRRVAHGFSHHNPDKSGGTFLEFWNVAAGKSLAKIPLDDIAMPWAFSPDGTRLVVYLAHDKQWTLCMYDTATGKEVHNIRLRDSWDKIAFAPDGKSLYLSHDGVARISQWDVATGKPIASYAIPKPCNVEQFVFTPDGKVLALGSRCQSLLYWDVKAETLLSPPGVPYQAICEVRFAPSGELFVASNDRHTAWWDPRTGLKKRDLRLEFVDPDHPMIWDSRPNSHRSKPDEYPELALNHHWMAPSGEFVASSLPNSEGGRLVLFDARTGKLLHRVGAHGFWVPKKNGAFMFMGNGDKAFTRIGPTVRIFDSRTGRDVAKFKVPVEESVVMNLAVDPRGEHVMFHTAAGVSSAEADLLLWDAQKKSTIRKWHVPDQRYVGIHFALGDRWIALAGHEPRLQLCKIGQGKEDTLFELPKDEGNVVGNHETKIVRLAFSPDGRQLACAFSEGNQWRKVGKIVIYEIASKTMRQEFVGHADADITCLAYSHDSVLLASGATNATALVWQARLQGVPAPPEKGEPPIDGCFEKMAGPDAKTAFHGMKTLAQAPRQTLKLLREKIAPAIKPDMGGKSIASWIAELNSGQFAVRSQASALLEKLGTAAEPEVREALNRAPDLEAKRRLEGLLDRMEGRQWTPKDVLHARAVEVLEAMATADARALLTRWTTGDPAAVLTEEARRAMARLGK